MTTKLALICDDHGTRVDDWVDTVRVHLDASWEVKGVSGKELSTMVSALAELEASSKTASFNPGPIRDSFSESLGLLDRADLVIFDSDLTPDPSDAKANGEEFVKTLRGTIGDIVARQIRSFTTAGFITVVNMHWAGHPADRVFDLTLMKGWKSYADLHISQAELSNEALWSGVSDEGVYHPWHWPTLREGPEIIERSEAAVGDLDGSVLASLGLDASAFSPRQADLFGKQDSTFRDLAHSGLGFRYQAAHSEEAIRRMAASVLRRWASRTLVVGQNVISDAPHLIARLSPLLGERQGDAAAWEMLSTRSTDGPDPVPLAAPARLRAIEPFVDRPVWDFRAARRQVMNIRSAGDDVVTPLDLVFAEDRSEHVDEFDAVSFETDVPGPYPRRYIAEIEGVDYEPVTRLL